MSRTLACLFGRSALARLVAIVVMGTGVGPGLAQEPKDVAGWIKQIEAALEAGKDTDVLTILDKAGKAFPDEASFRKPAVWFERHGEKRIKDKGYEAGLDVAERALKVLPANQNASILAWRNSIFRYWSQDLLDKKQVDASLKVLERGYALAPSDGNVLAAIAYHTQEALRITEAKSADAAIEHFQTLSKQFPKVDEVAVRGQKHPGFVVRKLLEQNKFKEAVETVDRYRILLPKPEHRAEVGAIAYDGWAVHFIDKKEWEAALDKYKEGLKAYPEQKLLLRNVQATVEEWAAPSIKAKKWDEAIRIFGVGLKYFPANTYLEGRKTSCEKMKAAEK